MLEVGPAAEILPAAVPVHTHRLALGDGLHQLALEGLVALLVVPDRVLARPHRGADGLAGGDDLAHPGLDAAQILGGEGLGPVEVVVPAVLDHRADGDARVGPELLHGTGHDMREAVADQLQRGRLVLRGVDRQPAAGVERPGEVEVAAVERGADRALGEAGRDVGRDLGGGHAGGVGALGAVGQGDDDLGGCAIHGRPPRRFGAYGTPGCGSATNGREGARCQRAATPRRRLDIDALADADDAAGNAVHGVCRGPRVRRALRPPASRPIRAGRTARPPRSPDRS